MSLTKITTNVIADNAITQNKISNTVTLGGPKIANVQYADASFTVLDDTAANTSGTARLIINGEGFNSGAIVIVGTTQATSTTRVSATQLRANVTAQVAGSYPIYVQNTDGGTAIRVGGVTFSNTPIWGTAATLTNQAANTSFNVSISATSDSSVTYSNTTALPAGTTLLSNGYFYGTVTIGAETTYTFDVKANDAENQDVSRTFSLTVTVTPQLQLWVWGSNFTRQFGLDNLTAYAYRSSPIQVGSQTTWSTISAGTDHMTALKSDGTLWTWGVNDKSQLGLNDTVNRSSPVQVGSSTNWQLTHSNQYVTAAIKTDGTLWMWGRNVKGELGINDGFNKSSPTQVGTGTDWSSVSIGHGQVLAIKTNGTLWAWGDNLYGQLGLNNVIYRSSPVQVGSSTDWSMVSCKVFSSLVKKTNGSIYSFGDNGWGTLGLSDRISKSSPTQIGTNTNWSKIFHGAQESIAIKTDGTLWLWGYAAYGQLGLGDTINRSSPTQVGSDTDWDIAAGGSYKTFAIKNNKSLWSWGRNVKGSLGLNDEISKSSPVQVGTNTAWYAVSVTMNNHVAIALKSA